MCRRAYLPILGMQAIREICSLFSYCNVEETDGERQLTTVAHDSCSRQLTLKKGASGDQVCDLLCVQLACYLERGPTDVDDAPAH